MPEEILETPQPVTEPKTTNWPKVILAAVLGLGLLAAAAYAGYWYGTESAKLKTQSAEPQLKTQSEEEVTPSPTPIPTVEDETKGWKTYISDADGFSFKYPSDWQVEENVNYIGPLYPSYTFFFRKKVEFMPGVSLFIVPKTTPEEWVGTRDTNFEEFATAKKINLDGAQATKVSGIPGALDQEWVFVDKDGTTLIFYAAGLNDELVIFNRILSTFKFLD